MKLKLLLLFVILASAVGMRAQEAYAVLSEDKITLTFYYDDNKNNQEGIVYGLNSFSFEWNNSETPDWYNKWNNTITTVIFDSSFAKARPTTTAYWFSYMKLTAVQGIQYLNTEDVRDMGYMFYGCSSLTSLDLSNFDTQKVTDMSRMFESCTSLTSLDVSSFDTQNVMYMWDMFYSCSSLTSLNVNNFDTHKVTDMGSMFYGCSSLTSLDLSNFNTQNVTDMSSMFYGCSSLISLDLSSFDTQKVTDMGWMFYGCSSLTSLDVSSFDTHKVTDMKWMFTNCSSLISLDLSNFNTQNVMNMDWMFFGCSSLTSLDVSSFDTQNITRSMVNMFNGCSSLTSLDLSSFETQNVKSMGGMFRGCSSLTSLDLSSFDTQNLTSMSYMFSGCSSLTSLDLSSFETQNVKSMGGMFNGCSSLTSLDITNFDTQNVIGMSRMFFGCSSLESLNLSSLDTHKVTDMSSMFYGCSSLISLDLSNFNTQNVTNMDDMFDNCSSLTSLDLSNFNAENLKTCYSFVGCSSLNHLSISASLGNYRGRSYEGIGSETSPCHINHPDGLDFGVDTSGDYFEWKGGFFTLKEDLTEEIKVTSDLGYITYCTDKALDFTNVEGMKAYIVVGYDGKVAKLSRIGIVPPETGLLLKADAGEYEVPYTEEDNYVMNMLIGVLEETTLSPTEGNMTNLVLANGKNGLGFYCLKGSGTIAAHRAYLQVPTRLIGNDAKFISMEFDDDVTAISGITTQEEAAPYYDLQGVRHEGKPTKQGIYIHNSKKVVVRD